LASYFASLRVALKELQDKDPNIIALGIGQYIPPLKDDENAETPEQIASHLSQYARFDSQPNAQQLGILAQIVAMAKNSSSAKTPAPTLVNEETVVPETAAAVSTPSEAPAPSPEPAAAAPASPSVVFDPSEFTGYAFMKDRDEVVGVESKEDKLVVSWSGPGDGSRIYLVSASNEAQPKSPATSASKQITTNSTVTLTERFRFITVYEFDAPKTSGRVFGRVETVGDVKLEFEAFSTQVRMRWTTDDPSAEVRIAKSLSNEKLPEDISPSFFVYEGGPNSGNTFVDEAVQPGDKFEYKIWLQRVTGGRVLKSRVDAVSVAIPGSIPTVDDFVVTTSEKGPSFVNISYKKPAQKNAKVLIYQVQGAPSNDLMSAIADTALNPQPISELTTPRVQKFIGTQIIAPTPRAVEGVVNFVDVPLPTDEIGSRTFIAVVELGDFFRIGEKSVIDQIGNVTHAELIDRLDYQLLRVEIPNGASFIEVWHTGMGQTWDSIAGTPPTRNVNILNEYRPNGGVLFAKPNPTLPSGIGELGVDPAKLFIRGASVFAGKPTGSPEVYELDYEGRIEVLVKIEHTAEQPEQRRGLFGGAAKEAEPPKSIVKFKIVAPQTAIGSIALHHLQTSVEQGFPVALETAIGSVQLDIQKYREWATYPTGPDGSGAAPLSIPNGFFGRFIPVYTHHNGSMPIFVVEQKINDAKVNLKVAAASDKTYKVILVGAKRSGKTTYVQAFLHQLENQFAPRFGSKLVASPSSPAAKFRLNSLHEFLDSGKLPLSTPSARSFGTGQPEKENDPRIPIKFEFVGGTPPFRSIELFDVAGEDMDKIEDIRLYSEELAQADLVVYLFDPLQEPNIAAVLDGLISLPEPGTNPFDVLVNLSEVLSESPNRNPGQKVAVAISKFDGLVAASALTEIAHPFQNTISKGMSVTRDPNAWDNKRVNEMDSWQVHQEVRALLNRVPTLNPFITAARDRFGADRMRFFVVSALGHSTFAEQINRAGITSFRVIDPVLWITSQPNA
jgi:hypothetical protein